MNTEQLAFDRLNCTFTEFRKARRKMVKQMWIGVSPLLKRIFIAEKQYPRLRAQDQSFFHRMQPVLCRDINSDGFTTAQLDAYLAGLKTHLATLRGHHQWLVTLSVYLLVVAAIYREWRNMIPVEDAGYATVVIIVSLIAAVVPGILERVKNQGWVADYEAFVILLEHEIERRKGGPGSGGEDSPPQ